MVAYTSGDCLPYFEGTDSPCLDTGTVCEPSTVWCDLAELLDTRFTTWDSVLNRTVVTVPFAQVKRTTPVTFAMDSSTSFPVEWEVSVQDSDSMVNLTADPNTVYVRRSGIWICHFTGVFSTTVVNSTLTCQVDSSDSSVPTPAFGRVTWVQTVGSPPDNFEGPALMFDQPFLVTDAALSGVSAISLRAAITCDTTTDVTMYEATMSVYWFAEVPS